MLKIKACTDACKSIESSEEGIEALESVSGMNICYSGVYAIVKIQLVFKVVKASSWLGSTYPYIFLAEYVVL